MAVQWSLVLFTLLAGTGAWMFAFLGVDRLRGTQEGARSLTATSVAALVLVIGGGLASVAHLSHPDRMLAALGHPTSGIFVEAVLIGLLSVAIVAFLVASHREASSVTLKALAAVGAVLAVALSFSVGNSYCMEARPLWNTPLLPIGYLLTACACGAAGRLVVLAATGQESALVRTGALETAGAAALALIAGAVYGVTAEAFGGEQAALYGGLVLFVGALVPLALGCIAARRPSMALSAGTLALAAALIGAGAFRASMWLMGTGIANYFEIVF